MITSDMKNWSSSRVLICSTIITGMFLNLLDHVFQDLIVMLILLLFHSSFTYALLQEISWLVHDIISRLSTSTLCQVTLTNTAKEYSTADNNKVFWTILVLELSKSVFKSCKFWSTSKSSVVIIITLILMLQWREICMSHQSYD